MAKLSELEARGELFGRRIRLRSWVSSNESVIIETKLSNGLYVGLWVGACNPFLDKDDHANWEHVEEPKPKKRHWLWDYGTKNGWYLHMTWMTKEEADKELKGCYDYRISPICPVEGVELP